MEHVKDILIQEIMTLERSAFEKEAIDMDSISFAGKDLKSIHFQKGLEKSIDH